MKLTDIKPTAGNILVKKLPDETTTKAGILLPIDQPINKQYIYVEVIAIGSDSSQNICIKIEVKPGNKAIVFGRGIHDGIKIDGEEYFIVKQADIPIVLED